jgi:putative glutamine amidotransferase
MPRPLIAIICNVEGYADSERAPAIGAEGWAYKQGIGSLYAEGVWECGGTPVLVPCLGEAELVEELLGRADGLLITGGADVAPLDYGAEPSPHLGAANPVRDATDRAAVAWAEANPDLPVLGICRGIQSYNAYAGGTLIQDIPSEVEGAVQHSQKGPSYLASHSVRIVEPDSKIAAILGTERTTVNSFHHQAVASPAPGMVVTAKAADGIVEAMERPAQKWCVLVQWHPEHMFRHDAGARKLFEAFVRAASGAPNC